MKSSALRTGWLLLNALAVLPLRAQYVGFGEASPNSKLDAVHTGTSGSTLEATQNSAANTSPVIQVSNSSNGEGLSLSMSLSSSTKTGIDISHAGKGSALRAASSTNSYASAVSFGYFELTGVQSLDHIAVHGVNEATSNYGIGVKGQGGYAGLYGVSNNTGCYTSGNLYGVRALGASIGAYVSSSASTGVYGLGPSYGVYGQSTTYGIYGQGSTYGVYANGNLGASGTKTFLIDHPLDPEHQYLRHFSIESDEVLNLYRGIAQLDDAGRATVELPAYFEAINTEFSYQLTSIGSPQQPWVAREIGGNTFEIAGAAGARVSWTVMARRNDRYIQTYPLQAESAKAPEHQGKYVRPELYGRPAAQGIFYLDPEAGARKPDAQP
ncbi:MAG: hypothetical protein NW241_10170 [Bacteroidia bacterium]|nr:hypothetical protein [Bacteroidia bacterium]